jgi:hypothetical protein
MRKTIQQAVNDSRIDKALTRAEEQHLIRQMDEIAARDPEPTEDDWADCSVDAWPEEEEC